MHLVANYLINSDKNMHTRYKITQKFQVIFFIVLCACSDHLRSSKLDMSLWQR